MAYLVSNPTMKGKAVRAAGGLAVIPAGKAQEFDEAWAPDLIARYEAAGLVVKEAAKAKPKPAQKAKE